MNALIDRGILSRSFSMLTSQRTVLITVCRDDLAAARKVTRSYADDEMIAHVPHA